LASQYLDKIESSELRKQMWPDVISNTDLWTTANKKPRDLKIKERR
jgi:hypothetical protein